MATIANFGWRKLDKHITPDMFWKTGDTQADEIDVAALMKDPKLINRFK